jgi:fructose/tagatose bisphosphate aldolase
MSVSNVVEGALEEARRDPAGFRNRSIDALVRRAVFESDPAARDEARLAIRRAAAALGILPASIQDLYAAMGRGEEGGFTTPAMNLRMLTYDASRAVFRAAKKRDVGAFILEIARSEMGYTDQRPGEYAAVVLAAAIKEGHLGPVFIQGDHFQANAKKFAADADAERKAIEALIEEAIPAGFLNIDIDTSTLVDMSQPTEALQQRQNFENAARFTRFIRANEPKGLAISIGGEIGEVGKGVSTPEEFRAFMDGYLAALPAGMAGVSKISINTGTSHGGTPLPDGTVAKVEIHFDAMEAISKVARSEYGLSGAVQHGASTVAPENFHQFPEHGASEVHLATEFQNMTYDALPAELRDEMYLWLHANAADERKPNDTDEQFLYRSRKKAIGPFKKAMWDLPEGARAEIGRRLEEKFGFLFEKLRVPGTKSVVGEWVKPVELEAALAGAGAFHRDDEAGD